MLIAAAVTQSSGSFSALLGGTVLMMIVFWLFAIVMAIVWTVFPFIVISKLGKIERQLCWQSKAKEIQMKNERMLWEQRSTATV